MIGAIDIGGTKIAIGIVDKTGRVLKQLDYPTEPHKGPAYGVSQMVALLRQMVHEVGGKLRGIGVGCTGPVYPEAGLIGNVDFLPGWENFDMTHELTRTLDVPVVLENDADCATLGEWAWGAGGGTNEFLFVTVGTGIGCGFVVNKRLYRGVNGSHPEIGHHVIDPSGPLCFCGARGCWESLASGSSMEKWAHANHPETDGISARQLCLAANRGDALAMEAIQRTALYLGIGIANLVTLFSPEVIALGGGLLQSSDLFMPKIYETVRANCNLVPYEQVRIVPAALGSQAGLIGAARAWCDRYTTD